MNFYIIQTVVEEDGMMKITWHKDLFYIFRDQAFKKADEMGSGAVVIELVVGDTWNWEERMETWL